METDRANGFLFVFSKLSKPISKAENFLKSHTQTIKYVVLGLLACGMCPAMSDYVKVVASYMNELHTHYTDCCLDESIKSIKRPVQD